jgi:peptidoglycan/xylan/chitin deacetylase (PgdA/CDA1 family)
MYNFLFHRISPARDVLWDPIDPKLFDRCVKFITNKYEVVRIEDFVENPSANHQKLASIVFDDGYKDNWEYAAPILDKYGVKASFYVVTDCIDKNEPTWTHVLEYYLQHSQKLKLQLPFDFLAAELQNAQFQNVAERVSWAQGFLPKLKLLTHEQRTQVIDAIKNECDDVVLPAFMMNWKEVRDLNNAGHYIGSHTVTHSMLGTMAKDEDQLFELKQSAARIEAELGYFPKTISYPVGSYNERTLVLAQEVGYKLGLAVKQDRYHPNTDGDFEIPRINLSNEPWWKTKLRLTNRIEDIKKLMKYK